MWIIDFLKSIIDILYSSTLHNACPRGSHIDLVYVYVPAFWDVFYKIWHSDRWLFIRDGGAQMKKKWVYFEQIIVKFGQNWVPFYRNRYTSTSTSNLILNKVAKQYLVEKKWQ